MNSDRGIGHDFPNQRQQAWQALATERAARVITKHLVEEWERI
jgi:hypothetical protein